jgi:hypothetical protein
MSTNVLLRRVQIASWRAMGIEPTLEDLAVRKNERFGATTNSKCDWRVKYRGTWGHVRLPRDTPLLQRQHQLYTRLHVAQ